MADSVRSRLKADAEEDYDLLRDGLRDAIKQTRPLKRKCEKCQHEVTFQIPDHAARVKAIEVWVAQFGKPPTDEKDAPLELDVDVTTLDPAERAALRKRILARYPEAAKGLAARRAEVDAERTERARAVAAAAFHPRKGR